MKGLVRDTMKAGLTETRDLFLLLLSSEGEADAVAAEVTALTGRRDFRVVGVPVGDWDRELSPWRAKAVFGGGEFGGGAEETLERIFRDVLPGLLRRDGTGEGCTDVEEFPDPEAGQGTRVFLCGYSLAGLFALWAVSRPSGGACPFDGTAAVSPSVWYPGWLDFAAANPPRCSRVYLSLGDREEKAKNPVLASVGDAIRKEDALLAAQGVPHVLEWNPGNHFAAPEKRLARGIAWLLNGTRGR